MCQSLKCNTRQLDPTRTSAIRRRFIAEVNRRFSALKKLITQTVANNDALGLTEPFRVLAAAGSGAFNFPRNADKVDGFMQWLTEQEDEQIFSIIQGRSQASVGDARWSDVYIESAYQRGIARGRSELKKQGVLPAGANLPGLDERAAVQLAFNQPIHADAVGLLYTRSFSELRGITQAMDQQISRVLAQGLVDGRGPRDIARELNKVVDKIGINRARTLARTEVIRAHHEASINTYQRAGVEGVTVVAEYKTAGDERVCPDCEGLDSSVFTLNEIRSLIPLHPNCRCVAIPIVPGTRTKGEKQDFEIGDAYRRADGSVQPKRGYYQQKTGKAKPPGQSVEAALRRMKKERRR